MDADAVSAPAFDGAAVPFEGADATPLDAAAALRKDLCVHTLMTIKQLPGPEALAAVRRRQRVPALARAQAIAEGGRPANVVGFGGRNAVNADSVRLANLTRLLMFGNRLGKGEIAAVLPATWVRGRVGAVVKDGRALFQIVPAPIPGHLQVFRPVAESGLAPESSSAPEPVSPPSLGRTPTQESVSVSSLGRTPAPDCVLPPPLHRVAAAGARQRDDVLIASDWGELAGAIPGPDHIMPVGGATRTLAVLAAYGADEQVFDARTGHRYHAILATLCGARVTATDVSARALGYARFNAALAGAEINF